MRRPLLLFVVLVVLVTNCERRSNHFRITEPVPTSVPVTVPTYIQGTVRLGDWSSPPGPLVDRAKVWLAGDIAHAVYSDSLGNYALPVDIIGSDSLTVFAMNGYTPGIVYGSKCSGSTKLMPASWGAVNVEIRLDHCSPI